ncbi:MAG: heavy metal sensor histidine kinase [Deltaproteobacteria bacterium]|nr:heavy metal sensor histidine kinase [Deltaproteobacteria bacterium]
MASRIFLSHTLSALGLLLLSMTFLYWGLVSNLHREDADFLAGKIRVLRSILREDSDVWDLLGQELRWGSGNPSRTKYYVRVLDEGGRILIETPRMGDVLPSGVFAVPARDAGDQGTRTPGKWRSPRGRSYLLASAWAEVGRSRGTMSLLQVGLDVSPEESLLADYRRKLGVALLAGILLSAGAGVLIARRGMRPLAEITEATRRIKATQLHERIGSAGWPRELSLLAVSFDRMLDRLEESFSRLSRFSADLAHELRTPINNLMGEAEVALSKEREPEEYRRILESSLEEFGRLSRMVDNLLFLARAENPETRIERMPLDAGKEIEATREFYEAVAREQRVEVTCHGTGTVHADPTLFRRAVSNILSNALRHTPPGGKVAISVREREDRSTEVVIRDTGAGIAPDDLPRIFDRFHRSAGSRADYPEGTGLGLAIVKSIMDLHGGGCRITSEPDQGTVVTLVFPRPLAT